MAEVIQFHCPACCITLRVPLEAAGQRGPCPHCQQLILAPNPYTGVAACRLAVEAPEPLHPPPVQLQPSAGTRFEPFRGVPAAAPEVPVIRLPTEPARKSQPAAWPAALGIGVMAAVLGFAGGYQSARPPEAPPASIQPPVKAAAPATAATKKPLPDKASPILSAPKATLDEFLAAPDWKSRSRFVLFPEETAPRMERYHQTHPDGPTSATRTSIEHCEANSTSNLMLVVFRVHTPQFPTGFTVAVSETPEGWKIDWDSFVEFRDELFIEFVTGKAGDNGRFHLVLLPSTASSSSEDRIPYILSDPVKGREFMATTVKGTETAKTLEALTRDGAIATPVLELARRTKPDGSYELEITGAPATNWRPATK